MKANLLFLISICSFQLCLQGQNLHNKFSKIEQYEIDLKECKFDQTAEAVKIFDIGKSYFLRAENSFDIIYERATRIKIFSEPGISWAEVEIPIYQEGGIYETVYDIIAYTYNYENGHLIQTKLDLKTCFEEKLNEYWKVVKFAMPDVKQGSIIEYKYKIKSQYIFNLRDWEFQSKIPTLYSAYEVRMIPFYHYSWLLQGATKFDVQETYEDYNSSQQFGPVNFNENVSNFVLKNVPSFKSEDYISSINDYIIKIDFQLAKTIQINGAEKDIRTTWSQMIKDLLKHSNFGKYVRKSQKMLTKVFPDIDFESKTQMQKFDLILNYAKQNFNWNKINSRYSNESVNTFFKNKHGNSADINLFVTGLLNEAGIEAHPVIISTRAHGKIKYDYPYSHFFNYVLIAATIDDDIILTDATEPWSANNRIPTRCINDRGLIIAKDKVEWIGLQTATASVTESRLTINLIEDQIKSKIITTASEYDALKHRKEFGFDEELIKSHLSDKGYNTIDSVIVTLDNPEASNEYVYEFETDNTAEIINEKIYLAPFLSEVISENPLKQKSRTYPVDFIYPHSKKVSSTIHIPQGYIVSHMPSPQKINNKIFQLEYSVLQENDILQVNFSYTFKQSIYTPNQYKLIRLYYNEIIKRGTEKVVFSKKALP